MYEFVFLRFRKGQIYFSVVGADATSISNISIDTHVLQW